MRSLFCCVILLHLDFLGFVYGESPFSGGKRGGIFG